MRRAVLIAILTASLSASPSFAGGSDLGLVTNITPQSGAMFFSTAGTRTSPPACATNAARWVFDTNTVAGQGLAATLLSAQAQGNPIQIYRTGTCSVSTDTETVAFIYFPTS